MKKVNNSQPLAVSTIFRPLNTTQKIVALGGYSTTQFYRQTANEWKPNHSAAIAWNTDGSQKEGPLRLCMDYSVQDPDNQVTMEDLSPQIYWFVDDVQVMSEDPTADFYLVDDLLYVRKNYTHLTGANITCEVRFTDPHVGRPTKDEQAARQLQAEKERQEQEEKEETLFGKKSDIPVVETPDTESVSGSMGGGTLLRLDEIKWLLSPALQEAVETVRDLRQKEADCAATAKAMALAGHPEEEVEPYSEDAVTYKQQYESIYEHVDSELAHVYVRLKEDTTYIAKIQAAKADPQEWRSKLRVYWDKFDDQQKATIKQQVIDDIKRNDPEQAKIREAEEKKKKEIADLIKYLTRKDKLNTPWGWWNWLFRRLPYQLQMLIDICKLHGCDAILKLPMWDYSRGAKLESAFAEFWKIENLNKDYSK